MPISNLQAAHTAISTAAGEALAKIEREREDLREALTKHRDHARKMEAALEEQRGRFISSLHAFADTWEVEGNRLFAHLIEEAAQTAKLFDTQLEAQEVLPAPALLAAPHALNGSGTHEG